MEKPIYVLESITYDYYEFSNLLTASNDYDAIIAVIDNHKSYIKPEVFNWWELDEEKKQYLYENELEHYRITKF